MARPRSVAATATATAVGVSGRAALFLGNGSGARGRAVLCLGDGISGRGRGAQADTADCQTASGGHAAGSGGCRGRTQQPGNERRPAGWARGARPFLFLCSINRGGRATASENPVFSELTVQRRLPLTASENIFRPPLKRIL